jgi:hypothetical protein
VVHGIWTDMPLSGLGDDCDGSCSTAVVTTAGDYGNDKKSYTFAPFRPVEGVVRVIAKTIVSACAEQLARKQIQELTLAVE